nr:MAG TPA: hypothetical protein [Caudoviricetes sp.]
MAIKVLCSVTNAIILRLIIKLGPIHTIRHFVCSNLHISSSPVSEFRYESSFKYSVNILLGCKSIHLYNLTNSFYKVINAMCASRRDPLL